MSFPFSSRLLGEATIQEIQLELIQRSTHDAFDGKRVAKSLLAHRDFWESVILDRLSLSRPGKLPAMGLIKLRDLSDNFWNADTLYVLTPNAASAKRLAKIAKSEDWGGEISVHDEELEVDDALGSGRETRAVVQIWWD